MDNIYKKLAVHLDHIPNGFPATESGVELKLLAKLFTSEEAELACNMSLDPLSAKAIAQATGNDERETYLMLKGMIKKGLLDIHRGDRGLCFKLIPFIVGFYERQNANIDQEFAQLMEDYFNEALYKMMTIKPSIHRIIPVEATIPVDIEVMPYEKASNYLNNAKSWGVLDCICRVQKKLVGKGCDHSIENCLVFSSRPNAYDRVDAIRALTREQALEILAQADREGLVHSTGNVQNGIDYICNCCTCSCGVMRGLSEHGNPDTVDRSNFYALVDPNMCSGCETCIARCQFSALSMVEDVCRVNRDLCLGCGLCVSSCPTAAIVLKRKAREDIVSPPETEEEWRRIRLEARKSQP